MERIRFERFVFSLPTRDCSRAKVKYLLPRYKIILAMYEKNVAGEENMRRINGGGPVRKSRFVDVSHVSLSGNRQSVS